MPENALRLVDDDGVLIDGDDGSHVDAAPLPSKHGTIEDELRAELAAVKVQLQGAERDIRSWRARYMALEADKEKKARSAPIWDEIERLFNEWRDICRHPRSDFTYDRFKAAENIYRRKGYDLCLLAIQGAGFDPFVKPQKNGKPKRFDDWKLIFRDEDTFEGFANRAPAEALAAYKAKQDEEEGEK